MSNERVKLARFCVVMVLGAALFAIVTIEGAARVLLYITRGRSTVGLTERTLYLYYQPFVMFGLDWDQEFAAAIRTSAAAKANPTVRRVLVLGGSTAERLPPDVLSEALERRFPGRDFEIINGASAGYNARQEVIVASIWGSALQPDIVLTLDGANDILHRLDMRQAGGFLLSPAYELAITHPWLAPFAHLMRQSQAVHAVRRLSVRRRAFGPADSYGDAVTVYGNAQRSISLLTKGLAAHRVMVLQPFMAFKTPLSPAERAFTWYRYREDVARELYEMLNGELARLAIEGNGCYVDGRAAFLGVAETIFSDDVHFVDEQGYRLLAASIVSNLPESFGEKAGVSSGP